MVAIAISGVVSMSIMTISQTGNRQLMQAEEKSLLRTYANEELKRILGDERSCVATFATLPDVVSGNNNLDDILQVTQVEPLLTSPFATVGNLVAGDRWRVDEITLGQFQPNELGGGLTGKCPLSVTFRKVSQLTSAGGIVTRRLNFDLYCRLNSASMTTIENCMLSTSAREGVWAKEYDSNKVFINYADSPGGFAAIGPIGANIPSFPLEVFHTDPVWKNDPYRRGVGIPKDSVYAFKNGFYGFSEVGDCLSFLGYEQSETNAIYPYIRVCDERIFMKNGFELRRQMSTTEGNLNIPYGHLLIGGENTPFTPDGNFVDSNLDGTGSEITNILVAGAQNRVRATDSAVLGFNNRAEDLAHNSIFIFGANNQARSTGTVQIGSSITGDGTLVGNAISGPFNTQNYIFGNNISTGSGLSYILGSNISNLATNMKWIMGNNISSAPDVDQPFFALGQRINVTHNRSFTFSNAGIAGTSSYPSQGEDTMAFHTRGSFHFFNSYNATDSIFESMRLTRYGALLHGNMTRLNIEAGSPFIGDAPYMEMVIENGGTNSSKLNSAILASQKSTNKAALSVILASDSSLIDYPQASTLADYPSHVIAGSFNSRVYAKDSCGIYNSANALITSGSSSSVGPHTGEIGVANIIAGSINGTINNCSEGCAIIGGSNVHMNSDATTGLTANNNLGSDVAIGGQNLHIQRNSTMGARVMRANVMIGGYENHLRSNDAPAPLSDMVGNVMIGGHFNHLIGNKYSAVIGGSHNHLSQSRSAGIIGGNDNNIHPYLLDERGNQSMVILGGRQVNSQPGGFNSLLFGSCINHVGTVGADRIGGNVVFRQYVPDCTSGAGTLNINQTSRFYAEFQNGYYLFILDDLSQGTVFNNPAVGWTWPSDRRLKENLLIEDKEDFYKNFKELEIKKWSYKATDPVFLGVFSEDFYDRFKIGEDRSKVSVAAVGGVTLNAAKILEEKSADSVKMQQLIETKMSSIEVLLEKIKTIFAQIETLIQTTQVKLASLWDRTDRLERKLAGQKMRICKLKPNHLQCRGAQ